MIKAYLINKELAILLKEAGFEDECTYYYEKLNIPENEKYIPFNFNVLNTRYSAPLTSHLIDWLDSNGIFVDIIPRMTNNGVAFSYRVVTNEKTYFIHIRDSRYKLTDLSGRQPCIYYISLLYKRSKQMDCQRC